jgi:hypothetical protein
MADNGWLAVELEVGAGKAAKCPCLSGDFRVKYEVVGTVVFSVGMSREAVNFS